MDFQNLKLDVHEGIATLAINRPEVYNALNTPTYREIGRAIDLLEQDDQVRVVIVTGNEKAFAAGADIKAMAELSALGAWELSRLAQDTLARLENLGQPVIAAVEGYALGGGCELALACDLIVAAESAKFGLPEINLGVIPGSGGTQRLSRLLGTKLAKQFIFSGDSIDAATAKGLGLVCALAARGQALALAKEWAQKLSAKGPVALKLAKRAINEGLDQDLATANSLEGMYFSLTFATCDQREGMRAFLEKRQPHFTGR